MAAECKQAIGRPIEQFSRKYAAGETGSCSYLSLIFNQLEPLNMIENGTVDLTKEEQPENNNTLSALSKIKDDCDKDNESPTCSKTAPSSEAGRSRPGKSTGLRLITNFTNGRVFQNSDCNFNDLISEGQEQFMLSDGMTEDDEVDTVLFKLAPIQDYSNASSSGDVTPDAGTDSDGPDSLSSSCTTPSDSDSCSGRRKSALKSPGLRPDTPNRKSVRFADALGLDLETVKHILEGESPPDIPQHAFRDLQIASTSSTRVSLSLTFQQPSGKSDFMHKLWKQNVCLENALISDFMIIGTIKVINIDYHKKVVVRYTIDKWRTFNEILATYVPGSHNGPTDRFSFGLSVPRDLPEGSSVYFAIRYDVSAKRYWDNNDGKNYSCVCYCDMTDDAIGVSAWTHFL
ncbi:protein phosphatase 1 regulatory subunit 3D-like [Anneissia japonica]|uniref:protein phosphatase 1 regulatory subunit 3D-like n=1 Tax=Anneissia japonica TaxID=1529436 RepID=UPI0014256B6C|nr:protein phosphatase 1 regulatory subunit 3D-like [Anneissia japonica]